MRMSVIVSDLLFYLPVVYLFVKKFSPSKDWYQVRKRGVNVSLMAHIYFLDKNTVVSIHVTSTAPN